MGLSTITIRQETPADHPAVFDLLKEAFKSDQEPDPQESYLVERLRKSDAFIPELSLVAESGHGIVGHILLTRLRIIDNGKTCSALALAPVSVLPAFQRQGIGGMLIKAAHEKAKKSGHSAIVLLGHADYYPRFGYQQASSFGITLPFEVPPENCMVIELVEDCLEGVSGVVEYPKEFFE